MATLKSFTARMIGTVREWWLRFGEYRELQPKQSPTVDSSYSSSVSVQQKHEVFLSFRGEDTRTNFISHLHSALHRKGIGYFIDYQLKSGEEISPALMTAIEESMISIIVLSKNYASSSWCLNELSKILECKETNGQMVVPIFYHVDPSDVRKQTGSFAEAFAEHVKKRAYKVEGWRAALVEIAGLAGYHLDAKKDRCESDLIKDIVEDISKKLIHKSSNNFKGRLVGIDSRIKQIESKLVNVHILGIWGMGGIGKTTIAEAIFHRICVEFEGYWILTNVREQSKKYGWIPLRDELLRNILDEKDLIIGTSLLPTFIYHRLRHKRVFIVLDDVDNSLELDLLPVKDCFGPGSRIIITSRDKQVLNHVANEIYEVEGLNNNEALQLFSLYAFQQNDPKQDFVELSTDVVHYAKGVPLALKVAGSTLYGRSKSDWEAYLNKLKKISDPKIDDVLRISYDGLDKEVQGIFLDIACFFKGNYRYYVEHILDDSYYNSVRFGISVLIDKSLVTISHNRVEMHDLLQQMGWNIILQEEHEPEKRSRLRTPEDIYHVLKNNTGTNKVEGMLLDMSKIRKVCLSSTAFERMHNLRLLKFYYADFQWERERERKVCLSEQGLESLPDNLCLLHWDRYPLKSMPQNFCPDNLVELRMRDSHIKRLWNGVQNLVKLKQLDLQGSRHLIEIPDLSRATALENINLDGCRRIEELPSSIEHLVGLKYLRLYNCQKLKDLGSSISKLKSLQLLSPRDCSNITKFPETPENLRWLFLSGTAIEQVPSSIECLSQLEVLFLVNCTKLEVLPASIKQLLNLKKLNLSNCKRLRFLPELPPYLRYLRAHDCISLEAVSISFTICPKVYHRYKYEFMNCTKLDQNPIWAKTQLGIQQLATEDVKLYHKVHKNQYPETSFSICLPGSEIPDWFGFQNEGSSVTIQLPSHLHHHKFVGFALCFVFAPYYQPKEVYPLISVSCRCNFKTNGDYLQKWLLPKFSGTDHVYVRYVSKLYHDYYREIGNHPNEASFEFFCKHEIIKKCGVHPLYAQDDLTEFPHRPSEECNPLMIEPSCSYDPMVEDSTTTKRTRDDYSNDEAEHKRLKL